MNGNDHTESVNSGHTPRGGRAAAAATAANAAAVAAAAATAAAAAAVAALPSQNAGDDAQDSAIPQSLVTTQYCFTLTTNIRQRPVGEMQGGYRVDFDFWRDDKAITFLSGTNLSAELQRLIGTASIVSGSDWAFVSQYGVVDFDSRMTARLGGANAADQCLIAGHFRGRANLADSRNADGSSIFGAAPDRDTVLNQWKAGLPQKSYIPLILAVTFEVPIEDFDNSHSEIYDKVRPLGTSLLIGTGTAQILGGPYSAVGEIKLDLLSVKPAEVVG